MNKNRGIGKDDGTNACGIFHGTVQRLAKNFTG